MAVAVVTVLVIRSDVNGWGWVVWALSAIGISVIRAPFERTNRENVITDDRQDTTESTVLALVGIGGGLVPLVHLLTGVFGFADYDLASWTYGVGAALTVVGLALFWRTHRDLGRNWSVTLEIRDEHTLVTDGIYARIRHPMYTAITVIYAATPFVLHNWIAGFVGLVSFLVLYAVRLPREEAMMLEHFGEQYADYRRRTGRLLPRLRSAR
ncbi:MAG: protein-S-isoprenylcysteine O-methyltransferase [Actinomycetota bacterium]